MTKETHMVISIDAEKIFNKIQTLFMIKISSLLGKGGNTLNLVKSNYEKYLQLSFCSMMKY